MNAAIRARMVPTDIDLDSLGITGQGRSSVLVPTGPALYPGLDAALRHPAVSTHWRTRGAAVAPRDLERVLFDGVKLSRVVLSRRRPHMMLGLVEILGWEDIDRYGHLAVAAFPPFIGSGSLIEAAALVLDEAFGVYGARQIYFELSEHSCASLASGAGKLFEIVGTLADHVFLDGRFQSAHIARVTAEGFAHLVTAEPWRALSTNGWRTANVGGTP